MDNVQAFFAGLLTGIFILMMTIVIFSEKPTVYQQAVDRGYAEYVVIDNEGHTKWQWKERK